MRIGLGLVWSTRGRAAFGEGWLRGGRGWLYSKRVIRVIGKLEVRAFGALKVRFVLVGRVCFELSLAA